eukprot:CCRYP_013096-RA/>CCRYP_013096-RA protein AED:0.20 eAED:0.20 QI:0/0/0.33/1/0/0/3/139/218
MGDDCRCILLIGQGKGFCSGIDVTDEKFFSGLSNDDSDNDTIDPARKSLAFRSQILEMQAAFSAVEECPVPVVAAIHGACVGAGIDLACCADVRLCSPSARFSVRESESFVLREAKDFTPDEALRIGFVSRISKSDDDLINTANEILSKIARNSPVAVTVTKSSLNFSRDHSVAAGLQHIALQNSTALMTEDLAKAFMADKGRVDGTEFVPLSSHSRL